MVISNILRQHKRIMFDTAPVIYFIEQHDRYGSIADELFSVIRSDGSIYAFSSVITLTEVLTQPLRMSRMDIAEKYRNLLLNSKNFFIYPVDAIIAEKAAELRARYSLRTPDALQIAVSVENNASLFITNDKGLSNIKEIEVLVLEKYV